MKSFRGILYKISRLFQEIEGSKNQLYIMGKKYKGRSRGKKLKSEKEIGENCIKMQIRLGKKMILKGGRGE